MLNSCELNVVNVLGNTLRDSIDFLKSNLEGLSKNCLIVQFTDDYMLFGIMEECLIINSSVLAKSDGIKHYNFVKRSFSNEDNVKKFFREIFLYNFAEFQDNFKYNDTLYSALIIVPEEYKFIKDFIPEFISERDKYLLIVGGK